MKRFFWKTISAQWSPTYFQLKYLIYNDLLLEISVQEKILWNKKLEHHCTKMLTA